MVDKKIAVANFPLSAHTYHCQYYYVIQGPAKKHWLIVRLEFTDNFSSALTEVEADVLAVRPAASIQINRLCFEGMFYREKLMKLAIFCAILQTGRHKI